MYGKSYTTPNTSPSARTQALAINDWFSRTPAHRADTGPVPAPVSWDQGAGTKARFGATEIDVDGHHQVDEIVQMLVTGKVLRVDHLMDHVSGHLYRVETIGFVAGTDAGPR